MRKNYNKLVRNNIPKIILDSGRECDFETMQQNEFVKSLKMKLVEEAVELLIAPEIDIVDELIDLYEVLDCIVSAYGIEKSFVTRRQAQKRDERGSFEKKIRLKWVEDDKK
jgi:predicted house-cleaning noncanonical NTP pyrophosphatase (MazG superfamily)